VAGAYG